MDETTYNSILDRLDDVTGRRRATGLIGCSPALSEFMAAISAVADDLRGIPNSPLGILISRTSVDESLDDAVLELCGRDASWSEVRLAPDANTYNSGQLFGIATRPSPFECPTGRVVAVRGLEHLTETIARRFARYLHAWCRDQIEAGLRHFHVVMLIGPFGGPKSFLDEIGGVLDCRRITLAPLHSRAEDIPFMLHDVARGHGGHLLDFGREGLDKFLKYSWPGDVAEIKKVVRRLYGVSISRKFTLSQIQEAIERSKRETVIPTGVGDPRSLWELVCHLCDECDKRTVALMATPFFAVGTTATAPDPWSSTWPELVYVRLVSWAYMKLIEDAEPNVRLALKFFRGLGKGADEEVIRSLREMLGRLRTFEQHRLQYGSERDQQTLLSVQSWFERACGSRRPSDQHFERCILALLLGLKEVLHSIVAFLTALEHDEYRQMILDQWQAGRERTWPKHRYEQLVTSVLVDLDRADLKPDVVTERLLPALQNQMEVIADDFDKARWLRGWLEQHIRSEFPSPPVIDGNDLLELGYPAGRELGAMRKRLNDLASKGGVSREELLDMARHELAQKAGPPAEVPLLE